jgi:glycerophosphoryl diester phosphodiesterase
MSWQLYDLTQDLMVARGGSRTDADHDARFLRRRIASAAWLLGVGLIWLLVASLHYSWIVAVVGIVALVVGLWLFAERADQVSGFLEKRLRKS